MNLKIGDHEVDLSQAFPMTLRDWKSLEEAGVLEKGGNLPDTVGADEIAKLVHHFVRKVNDGIELDAIYDLAIPQLNEAATAIQEQMGGGEEPDPS